MAEQNGGNNEEGVQLGGKEMGCNKYNVKEKDEGCSAEERERNIEGSKNTGVNREEDCERKESRETANRQRDNSI